MNELQHSFRPLASPPLRRISEERGGGGNPRAHSNLRGNMAVVYIICLNCILMCQIQLKSVRGGFVISHVIE